MYNFTSSEIDLLVDINLTIVSACVKNSLFINDTCGRKCDGNIMLHDSVERFLCDHSGSDVSLVENFQYLL